MLAEPCGRPIIPTGIMDFGVAVQVPILAHWQPPNVLQGSPYGYEPLRGMVLFLRMLRIPQASTWACHNRVPSEKALAIFQDS